jgi:HEPN domain-containing protein
MSHIEDAFAWIEQARSDARTAEHVTRTRHQIREGDVGCHVALLCAQSFEKCIKACMCLVGQAPTRTHEVEAAIDGVLAMARERA